MKLTTGTLTAKLKLPDATGSFKEEGVIPVTATVQFIDDVLTKGRLNLSTGAVRTTSKITLRIVNLTVSGVGVPVGSSCETSAPVVVTAASQAGFNPLPGPDNTIALTLGKAKVAS